MSKISKSDILLFWNALLFSDPICKSAFLFLDLCVWLLLLSTAFIVHNLYWQTLPPKFAVSMWDWKIFGYRDQHLTFWTYFRHLWWNLAQYWTGPQLCKIRTKIEFHNTWTSTHYRSWNKKLVISTHNSSCHQYLDDKSSKPIEDTENIINIDKFWLTLHLFGFLKS